MKSIAELGLAVHSESAVQAAENLDEMVAAGVRAEQVLKKVGETSEQAKARLLALAKATVESSSYQETLNRAYEATAGSAAAAAREQLNQSAALRQSAKSAFDGASAQEKLAASERKATTATTDQARELEKLLGQIDPATAALARLDKQQQQLGKLKAFLPADEFAKYNSKIDQARSSLGRLDEGMSKTGASARQTSAALRTVPSQVTDIFTSIAAGQPIVMVALQQGGQLKDSFGGIGAAAQAVGGYILGLVNPFTLAATAAAALGYVYYDVEQQVSAFNKALFSGTASSGQTASSLDTIAKSASDLTGNISSANDAVIALAGSSKLSQAQFVDLAQAASAISEYSGKGAAEVASDLANVGDSATKAAEKISSQYGLLTSAQYEVIAALDEQGRKQEALDVLSASLNENAQHRLERYRESLSDIERDWNDIGTAISNAYSKVKAGLFPGVDDQIENTKKLLEDRKTGLLGWLNLEGLGPNSQSTKFLEERLRLLEKTKANTEAQARAEGEAGRAEQAKIEANKDWNALVKSNLSDQVKLQEDINKAKLKGVAAGRSQAEIDKEIANIQAKYDKSQPKGKAGAADLTGFNDADNKLKSLTASLQNSMRILDASQKAGLISSQQYAEQKSALIQKEKTDVEAAYQGEIAALEAVKEKSSTTSAQRIQLDQKISDSKSKMVDALKKLDADQEVLSVEMRGRIEKDEAAIKAFAQTVQDSLNLAQQGLDNQLAGFGLSDRDRARLQEDLKIRQDYQKQMERLTRDYGNIVNPTSGDKDKYDRETRILEDALGERLSKQDKFYKDEERLRGDWSNGVSRAWRNYVDEASDAAGMTQSAFSNAFTGIEDVFVDFITTGKASFKDFANSVLADLARIVVKQQIIAPLLNAVFGGGGNGGGATSFGGAVGSMLGGSGSGGSDSNGWGGMVGLGKNLYSVWNAVTGVGAEIASGYATGGLTGAASAGASYYGTMISNMVGTISGGLQSVVGAVTGQTAAQAATAAANAATSAALQGAVTEGAASIGANIGVGGAAQGAASAGSSGMLASMGAMWPLAVIMGMYQSGKLYDAGVRPDAGEVRDSAGGTTLGKVAMTPGVLQAKALEGIDNALSKVVGGKWAAILSGSTFHQAVWTAVGGKLFGTGYQTKDTGIELGVEGGVFDAQQYTKQKKKGGWLSGSSKTRYLYEDLPDESMGALGAAFNEKIISSLGLFTALGVQLSDSVLDGLNVAATRISTQDKTPEAIQAEFNAWFSMLGDSAVAAISDATNSGVSNYSFDNLTTFVNNLYSINDVFKLINVNALPVSVWGGKLAEQYVAMAGGMEALSSSVTSYYNAFFTETERADDTLEAISKQFASMNLALPDSRDGFRAMVEGIDSTTDAGRSMFLTLMGLSGSAASAFDILEQRASAANEALIGSAAGAQSALQRAISAQQKAATEAYNATNTSLNDMASTATENVSGLTSVGNDLSAALKALRGDSDDAVKMLRAQAQATLQSALATARTGGSLSGFTGLSDALDTVSSNNTDLYGSMEDFARDQGRTANVVAELNGLNGKQLTTAEKSLAGLKEQIDLAKAAYDAQMAAFDSQLEFAQAQMDALNGVDNSVMGVTAAINAMNASVVAALMALAPGAAQANTPQNNASLVDTIYKSVLGRDTKGDASGAAFWAAQLQSGAMDYDQIAKAIAQGAISNSAESAATKANAGKFLGIPGYASGGDFGGGLRLVGENGPELEVTGPSRIFNANQTASMMRGGGDSGATAAEIREFRREMESNATYMAQLTKTVADGIDTLVNSGVQILGTVETKAVA